MVIASSVTSHSLYSNASAFVICANYEGLSYPSPRSLIQFSETSGQTVSLIFPASNFFFFASRVLSRQTSSLFLSLLSLPVWAPHSICFVSCSVWSCEVFMSDLYLSASVVITNGACSFFLSTYPHSVCPNGGARRLYLCDCYTRFMLGYPRIACYCTRLTLPQTDVQWRAI